MPSDHSEAQFGNHTHSGIIEKTGQKNVSAYSHCVCTAPLKR